MADNSDHIAAAVEDALQVEAVRQRLGDAEAARFQAELYLRRAQQPAPSPVAPASSMFSGFPRWLVVLVAIWIGLLETADKLPRLLLAFPAYEATLAEYQAKMMQPDVTTAQLEKARNEAKASAILPASALAQYDKARHEAEAASYLPRKSASDADIAEVNAHYAKDIGKYP
jgi:hypothetical protein